MKRLVVLGLCAGLATVGGCAAPERTADAPPQNISLNPEPAVEQTGDPPPVEPVVPEPTVDTPGPQPEPALAMDEPANDPTDKTSGGGDPPGPALPPLHPAWSAGSTYNSLYLADAEPATLQGEVESVGTFVPADGAEPGLLLGLQTEGGVVAVHVAPLRYLRGAGVRFDLGEALTLEGRWTEIAGVRVLLAQAVTRGEVRLELRDAATGAPVWSQPADDDEPEGGPPPPVE